MGEQMNADRPVHAGERQYHLGTAPGEIAPLCLLVGSPSRAKMIAEAFFAEARQVGDEHRGLKSFTGTVDGIAMSVVTTGMGSATTGIVLPEAVRCGAQTFIRVGSCGTLWEKPMVGDSAICTGAVRLDGASVNWAPIEYPAVADYRIVSCLVRAAQELGLPYHVGIGATTTCFNEGQARPDDNGYIPPRLQVQHDELVKRGVLFYSMEEATLFVWATTHGGYPAGAVDAIYAQRSTGAFEVKGDEAAAHIAIRALENFHAGSW